MNVFVCVCVYELQERARACVQLPSNDGLLYNSHIFHCYLPSLLCVRLQQALLPPVCASVHEALQACHQEQYLRALCPCPQRRALGLEEGH